MIHLLNIFYSDMRKSSSYVREVVFSNLYDLPSCSFFYVDFLYNDFSFETTKPTNTQALWPSHSETTIIK